MSIAASRTAIPERSYECRDCQRVECRGVKGMSPVAISPFSWRFRRGRRKRDVPSRLVGGPGTSLSGIDEDLKHPLAARLVLCPVGVGLTVEHLPIILDALRRPFTGNSKERDDRALARNMWCR